MLSFSLFYPPELSKLIDKEDIGIFSLKITLSVLKLT